MNCMDWPLVGNKLSWMMVMCWFVVVEAAAAAAAIAVALDASVDN